jgi:uracil-DNA glycosylase
MLEDLAAEARACTVCAAHLPLGPRPIFRVSATARLLIISQAPGTAAHNTHVPWNDASGDRLRGWLGIGRDDFYDTARLAIMPMGFCYPGRLPQGGDNPPRPECAPLWHHRFLPLMPAIELTLLIGGYAQAKYLGPGNMTENVRNFAAHPKYFALPHPSWRTIGWQQRNPWFATDVLPPLRAAVARLMTRAGVAEGAESKVRGALPP